MDKFIKMKKTLDNKIKYAIIDIVNKEKEKERQRRKVIKMKTLNEIKNGLEANLWVLEQVINDLQLDELYFYDDLDEMMEGRTPTELANACHFGDYNPCADYYAYNNVMNIESYTEMEREETLIAYLSEVMDEIKDNDELRQDVVNMLF